MKIKTLKNNIKNFRLYLSDIIYSTIKNEIFYKNEIIYQSEKDLQEIYLNASKAYTNTIYGTGIKIDLLSSRIEIKDNFFIKYIKNDYEVLIELEFKK